jgi:hypothetical protein
MRTSGCLTTLRDARARGAEQHVRGDGPLRRDLGDHKRLELVEPSELLIEAGGMVVAGDERVGKLQPTPALGVVHRPHAGAGGAAQVPTGHDVGVGVVVDMGVVLVGTHYVSDVPSPARIELDPRRPPARGLDKQLEPGPAANASSPDQSR